MELRLYMVVKATFDNKRSSAHRTMVFVTHNSAQWKLVDHHASSSCGGPVTFFGYVEPFIGPLEAYIHTYYTTTDIVNI